jgi:hypothetical protein
MRFNYKERYRPTPSRERIYFNYIMPAPVRRWEQGIEQRILGCQPQQLKDSPADGLHAKNLAI